MMPNRQPSCAMPMLTQAWQRNRTIHPQRGSDFEKCGLVSSISLARRGAGYHALGMFLVTEADADAIRTIFNQEGELPAAMELRRRFRGITDNAQARAIVRTIVGWKPLPAAPSSVIPLRPRKTKAVRETPKAK